MSELKDLAKDKFVAFAFAAAETFLEVNLVGKIIFQTGLPLPASNLNNDGKNVASLADIIHPEDIDLFNISMNKLKKFGRVGPINLKLGGKNNKWVRTKFYGICLNDKENLFYLSLRASGTVIAIPTSNKKIDKPTGLLNKDAFAEVAAQAMQSSSDNKITMASFAGLKKHEETASKEDHEKLLKDISAQLKALSIEGEAAARIGDEEFAIINDGKTSMKEIEDTFNDLAKTKGLSVVTKTMNANSGKLDSGDIISAVSYTLEKFKFSKGKMEIENFNEAYEQAFEDTQNKIKNIKSALEKNTFRTVFQPIVGLADGKLHHYEVLARPPENFKDINIFELIQFIEATGLSEQFDQTIATLAIEYIKKSHKLKDFISLAINISGSTIQNEGFVKILMNKLLSVPRLDRWLVIEITESSKILNLDAAAEAIQKIRDKGFTVCLDDFGAGASGYQYLHKLKIDCVKIDGIYVREMMENKESMAFIKSMVSLCKDLDIKTIAEYIETPEQYNMLLNLGVDYGQGYFYGKPEFRPSYVPLQKINKIA